jgi:acyl-CoA synthetase (AMP-forming)/AMP-acid ligase II
VSTAPDPESLAELIRRRAASSPRATFLEDARSERRFDFAGFAAAIEAWTHLFEDLGVPSGGAVIVAVRDPLSFAVVHLAAISTGRRSVPLNPDLPDGEPRTTSGLIGGAALVVLDGASREPATGIGSASASVDHQTGRPIEVQRASAPMTTPGEFEAGGAAVLFTSGSTGVPKGVELSERQLLFVANEVARNNALTVADRGFNSLPMFHVNAEVVGLLATLVAGSTLVLDVSFHRTGFWELLKEREITWLNAVPAILAVLTRDGGGVPQTTLRFIRSASAPLPDAVRIALGSIPLVLSYGMTEGASQITATSLNGGAPEGSVGLPLGGELVVRSQDGHEAPRGEVGALWIRGPGIVSSYLFGRAPERFDETGWLSTGDLGSIDADGYVYLAGRSDDVINRGGEKVYPAEVEEVLLRDARVLEAVVVGRADPILGQVPVAYVIASSDYSPVMSSSADELVATLAEACLRELPRFKRPVEISLVPDLPRAAAGKVQRSKVRELAAPSGETRP